MSPYNEPESTVDLVSFTIILLALAVGLFITLAIGGH
jgi:hypothetical protein